MSLGNQEYPEESVSRFEAMLKTNDVYFFDAEDFETIIHHYLNLGRINLAKKALMMGAHQHPGNIELQLLEVEILIFEDEFVTAHELLNLLESLAPLNEELYIQRAHIYSRQEQHLKAIDQLKIALKLTDEPHEIFSFLGMEYLFIEDYSNAASYFKHCLDLEPNDDSSMFNLISCYEYMNLEDEAVAFLSQHLERNPYNELAWSQLGKIYLDSGDYEEAIAAFDFALISDEGMVSAYFDKGLALASLGRWNEAILCYEESLSLFSEDAEAYYKLGVCHNQLGNIDLAIGYHKKSLKTNPVNDEVWASLVGLLLKKGKIYKALDEINKALDIDTESPILWDECARVHQVLGNDEMALYALEQANELEPLEDRLKEGIEMALKINDYSRAQWFLELGESSEENERNWSDYKCLIEIKKQNWQDAKILLRFLSSNNEKIKFILTKLTDLEKEWFNKTLLGHKKR